MAKKVILGECQDILREAPVAWLEMFDAIRKNEVLWSTFQSFAKAQKDIKMDQIYRLRRPRTQEDMVKNAIDHEYYASRISSLVLLLQLMENAGEEMERRARKEK